MTKRPSGLIYGADDKPPFVALILLGLQHAFLMTSTLVLPVVIVREIGGTFIEVQDVVCFSMIAAGLGTLLQALRKGPLGSGFLCPNLCGPSYLSVSVNAAWIGGLPLMHGMTMVAGIFEGFFSRVVRRLQFLFPTEVLGLVVLMVGVALIPLGTCKFLGVEYAGDPLEGRNVIAASITLLVMIGLNLWSRSRLKLYCVLIGMAAGYAASSALGILTMEDWARVAHAPWFRIPGSRAWFAWKVEASLVIPFAIIALCASLKSFGNLVTCQKINDEEWKEPDMKNVSRGLLADAVSVFMGGFLGGMAVDTSASNIGLSAATSATSRWIGFMAGGLFICLAFLPKATAVISIVPPPVMGAIVIFVTSFMLLAGIRILMTRPIDARMTFVVGISLIFGLSADIHPEMYQDLPNWLRTFFSSSLILATASAVVLNQLFSLRKPRQEE